MIEKTQLEQTHSQPMQTASSTDSIQKKHPYMLFFILIVCVLLAVLVAIGIYLKSQGQLHTIIPGGPHASNSGNDYGQLMQELGCNSPQSCTQACAKPENTSTCQQFFRQFGQGNQNNSAGQSNNSPDYAMAGNNGTTTTASLPSCQGSAFFDHLPTDPNSYSGVEPLGHMNGEHVLPDQADHVYINLLPGSIKGTSRETDVYAPGNVTLLQVVKKSDYTGNNGKNVTDYLLEFSPCRSVIFTYDHIRNLNSDIVNALAEKTPTCQQGGVHQSCTYSNVSVKLSSGEKLGVAGGPNTFSLAFDFGGVDIRTKPLAFINTSPSAQTGVTGNSYFHTVCPLDYFTDPLKSTLYDKLTMQNSGANGIPSCGTTMQDKAGTAQGNWYHQGSTQSYQGLNIQGSLAIVHSNLDPSKGEISAGTDLLPSSDFGAQMMFTPQSSGYINREPSHITPDGHVYCFEGPTGAGAYGNEGHVNIKLITAMTMEVAYGNGACGTNLTITNPLTYTR